MRFAKLAGGLLSLVIWGISACPAIAAPGDLDTSFGSGGKSEITTFKSELVSDVVLQQDGKILLSGTLAGPSNEDIFVARLVAPQGTLDTSYGLGTGASRLDFGGADIGGGLVLQADGKIDVSGQGTTTGPGGGVRVVAAQLLNPQGTLDPGFGGGTGFLASRYDPLGTSGDQDASFAAAKQGSNLIVAGVSAHGGATDMAVARVLNPAGAFDSGFASGGTVKLIDFGGSLDIAHSVALAPDGKIVVAGVTGPTLTSIGVARLTANGDLDNSFNGNGKATVPGTVGALAVQPDGKVIVGGSSGGDFTVARFNTNGTLDQTFGSGGRASVNFGTGADTVNDIAVQPDGKIVLAGASSGFAVARLQPNGSLDTTFGTSGKTSVAFRGPDSGQRVALQPDGKIVVAGVGGAIPNSDLAIARLQGDPGGSAAANAKCAGKKATIIGTNAKDKLKGTRKRDVIVGLGGKDTIKGLKGNDLICGGKGKDRIFGGPGNDTLLGQQGNDFLKGGPGRKDKVKGGAGKDVQKP